MRMERLEKSKYSDDSFDFGDSGSESSIANAICRVSEIMSHIVDRVSVTR